MATMPRTLSATTQVLQAVNESGWRRGLANLLRNENRMWWGTHKWLVHLLLWLVLLNGLILLIGLTDGQETNNPVPLYETLRGRLDIHLRRDTMIGLCIGMREPRCYDGISDRLNRRAMGLDRTDFPTTRRTWSPPHRQPAARD